MKGPESGVLRECLSCFSHHGFQVLVAGWKIPYEVNTDNVELKGVVWRNNVGAVRSGTHLVRFGIAGLPDIIGITRGGMFVGCECKSPIGRVSEMQKWFHLIALRLGGYAFVARSYEDCDRWLKEAGL